jgi:hypothetical protein
LGEPERIAAPALVLSNSVGLFCLSLGNADLLLAVRCGVGAGAAGASVLAVATIDPVGEAVAVQSVVARIAE